MDKSPSTAELAKDFNNVAVDEVRYKNINNVIMIDGELATKKTTLVHSGSELQFVVADKFLNGSSPSSSQPPSSATSIDGKGSSVDSGSVRGETPIDPWDIIEEHDTGTKWADLSIAKKIWKVFWVTARLCTGLGLLYLFVCSLDILQDSFQLLSGRAAGEIFTSSIISNPVCGLMVGVFVTVLVQSSSTSTSIVVSMVGSSILDVQTAIPIIMGANIGTTVTNTLVALTQSPDRDIFRRAFAGATVHDMFNWLTVIILLPIEVISGYLFHMTEAMTHDIGASASSSSETPQFLKVLTEPLTKRIVQVDKKVITAIAEDSDRQKFPLVKYYCTEKSAKYTLNFTEGVNETAFNLVNNEIFTYNVKTSNSSDGFEMMSWTEVLEDQSTKCSHWFVGCGLPDAAMSEAGVGALLLVGSLAVMIACLVALVKILNSLLHGPMRLIVRKHINADFPGRLAFLTSYVAMLAGAGITVLVQSSSVFTSTLTPLVGLGIVTVERVYPLTLGSNIGTTVTGILAALTADATMIRYTLQIALCHLFFNISGILIWFPVPFMRRVPTGLAKQLGNTTAKYRWFAVVYLLAMFLILPMIVFALSLAGLYVLIGIGLPLLILLAFVVVVNVLQAKRPQWLHPAQLRTWDFLPMPLHSLAPYDRVVTSCLNSAAILRCKAGIQSIKCCRKSDDSAVAGAHHNGVAAHPTVSVADSRRSSDSFGDMWAVKIDRQTSTNSNELNGVVNRAFVDGDVAYETISVSKL